MAGEEILFEFSDCSILRRDGRYFARYDAGVHQIRMREDEISPEEAALAQKGEAEAIQVLWKIQRRLIDSGIDPYRSNTDKRY